MNLTRKWLSLWIVLLCCPHFCKSQDVQIDKVADEHGGYFMKWDTVQERLIAYRSATDAAAPAALFYGGDGHSLPVYPLRDIAGSAVFNVFNAAATPEGGIVLGGFVEYGPPPRSHFDVRSVLLTYGPAGNLEKVWNVAPYEFDLVVVDGQGNVYGLGNADLEEPYFVLVKYSPEGKVLGQFLSTSLFTIGAHILSPGGGNNGVNQMFIQDNVLFVWFARTAELLRFSLSGELLSRVSLAHSLGELTAASGNDRIIVRSLAADDGGQMIAQVAVWNTQTEAKAGYTGKSLLVRLSPEGSYATPLPIAGDRAQFLGKSSTGKLVFYEPISRTLKQH
jgi:hypothetical protein